MNSSDIAIYTSNARSNQKRFIVRLICGDDARNLYFYGINALPVQRPSTHPIWMRTRKKKKILKNLSLSVDLYRLWSFSIVLFWFFVHFLSSVPIPVQTVMWSASSNTNGRPNKVKSLVYELNRDWRTKRLIDWGESISSKQNLWTVPLILLVLLLLQLRLLLFSMSLCLCLTFHLFYFYTQSSLQFNAFFDGIKIINLLNRWLYKRKEETTTHEDNEREREKSVNFVCMAHAL